MDPMEIATIKPKKSLPAAMEQYKFKPGHVTAPNVGRPKGSKNAQTILLQSAPRIARRYVKEALAGSPTLLVDSRKWILPVESERQVSSERVVIFVGESSLLPRAVDRVTLTPTMPRQQITDEETSSLPE